MMNQLIVSDFVKMKRSSFLWVGLIIPLVVLAYEIVNFTYRGQYVNNQLDLFHADSMWSYLLWDNSFLIGLGVPLGITISASMIANIEHQANSWKQTLSFPVSRIQVYLSKFFWLFVSSIASAVFFALGMIVLGKGLGFESAVPWKSIWTDSISVYLAALPFMAVQLWLSMVIKNQAFSIAIGSISTIMGLFLAMSQATRWLPWALPVQSSTIMLGTNGLESNPDLSSFLILACIVGFVIILIGAVHFTKRDVQ